MKPWWTFLLVFALPGCSDGAERRMTAQVDTIGPNRVRIANTGEPSWDSSSAWRLEEDLRVGIVGGTEGDPEQFGAIASIAVDSRGWIYVLDSRAQEIRVFDRSGEFSHLIGQPGSGPGEFQFARALVILPGDSLIVRDDGTMRYTVFGPDGRYVRSHRRGIVGTNSGASPASIGDGAYLDWAPVSPDGRFGSTFHLLPIRYGSTFDRADTFPPLIHTWEMLPNGMPQTRYSGKPLATADANGRIWIAESSRYEIHRRTLAGDTTLTLSLPATPPAVGEEEREKLRRDLEHAPDYLQQVLEALPETKPVLRMILPDNDGHLFVFPDVPGRPAGNSVDVFRDDGVFLGRLDLPSGVTAVTDTDQLAHVTAEHLFVVSEDQLGVPSVVRLRLIRPR